MRRVIIMRGLPGSGKSAVAKALAATAPSRVLSTDDYFMYGNRYVFDPARLAEAHGWNLRRFEQALADKVPLVIVDNTNVLREHMQPYIDRARTAGYSVRTLTVEAPELVDEALAATSRHSVPAEVIAGMRGRFER